MPAIRSAQSPPGPRAVDETDEWCTDATTGGARPTREDALRWVHDNAMANGSGAPLTAMLAGDLLRTAAYTFWKAARKLRWVCKGIRTGSGLEARPQAAADGAREAATPTANAAGLQPTQDDGAETPSDHQQPQAPGAATRALWGPAPTPPRPKPTSMGAPRAAALRSSSLKKRKEEKKKKISTCTVL